MPSTGTDIADLLERLAFRMREDGDRILAEATKIKENMDDAWHLGPVAAGRQAMQDASNRLGIPEEEMVILTRLIWRVNR